MSTLGKVLLLELWFLFYILFLGWFFLRAFGAPGLFLHALLFGLWCWGLFVYFHYRFCRQEEFLHVLHAAAAANAPLELVLESYLQDRPREGLYRFWVGTLLFFVFPGFYWIHKQRRFDARLVRVVDMLEAGVPLDRALTLVPGVVSREIALAACVGRFTGRLDRALQPMSGERSGSLWSEMVPRLLYPLFLLAVVLANMFFLIVFVVPRFERILVELRLRLPMATQEFIRSGRWLSNYSWMIALLGLNLVILVHVLFFSSWAKWHCPLIGRLYRLHYRGQFLRMLGSMLETDKPLPQILDFAIESGQLPWVVKQRAERLQDDLMKGRCLSDSLLGNGLVTESMRGLIVAAEKAQNLPWVLQELGEALVRRSVRIAYRLTMAVFPITVFACACLVAFIAESMFLPLIAIIEGLHG